jgi:hypothetical protein
MEHAGGGRERSPLQLRIDFAALRKEPSEPVSSRSVVSTSENATSTTVSSAGAELAAGRAKEHAGGGWERSPLQPCLDAAALRRARSEPVSSWSVVGTNENATSTSASGASTIVSPVPTDAAGNVGVAASSVGSENIRNCLRAEIERLQRQSRTEHPAEVGPEAAAPARALAASPRQEPQSRCLEQILAELASERSEREAIAASVVRLEKRLAEGVASIREVASARVVTDSATDTMIGALRGCVDELRDQCAWPPKSASPRPRQLAPTMGEAVLRQQREIEELRGYVENARAQQEEQQRHVRALASRMDEMEEHAKRVDRDVSAIEKSCSSRQNKLEVSVQALQESVARLGLCREGAGDGIVELKATVQAVQGQLRTIQGDYGQVRSSLAAISEQQKRLQQPPPQAREAPAVRQDTEVMQALRSVLERQQQLQDAHQRQESDLVALRGAVLEGGAGEGNAAPAAPVAERASGAKQAAGGGSALQLPGVRPRASTASGAADVTLGRVDPPMDDKARSCGALQAELGAVAGSVSRLAVQIEHLQPCRSSPCSSHSPQATPRLSCAPSHAQVAQEPQGSPGTEVCRQLSTAMEAVGSPRDPLAPAWGPCPPATCTVEGAQALREQLAVLMARVRQLPPASETPGGGGGKAAESTASPAPGEDMGKQDPARLPDFDGLSARLSSAVPQAPGEKKAPSPRKWLTEPLAVIVGRSSSAGALGSLAPSPRSVINAAGA